jgi:hypothetical protein
MSMIVQGGTSTVVNVGTPFYEWHNNSQRPQKQAAKDAIVIETD